MALASGYLPAEQAPIFTADDTVLVGNVEIINGDSGTDSAIFNIWYKKHTAPVAILVSAPNHELLAGEPTTVKLGGKEGLEMDKGDTLLGEGTFGSYLHFTVNRKT